MAKPLDWLTQLNPNWLTIPSLQDQGNLGLKVRQLAEAHDQELQTILDRNPAPRILLATSDPLEFIARFVAATSSHCSLFLGNPNWTESEWQQVLALVQPDLIWASPSSFTSSSQTRISASPAPIAPPPPTSILIPTGGSSGQIRFAIHTWQTLTASVEGFRQYFALQRINSCCLLPLHHVSGLMQVIRSLISGGQLVLLPKTIEGQIMQTIDPTHFFISLVPTQLQRFLEQTDTTAWLSKFQTVLLGGAPAWSDLLEQARQKQIRLAPTYGMTETASQVVTLQPDDFLQGRSGCGQPLPHTEITIQDPSGQPLPTNQVGQITMTGRSLFLGYYPPADRPQATFQTDDLGYFDTQGYLHVVGRSSDKIITGGENVFPAEVEACLYKTGLVREAFVLGVPDRQWGEAVTAVYVPSQANVTITQIQAAISTQLSKFKQPKHWLAVEKLPRNDQGKINRRQLREWVAKTLRYSCR